MPFPKGKPRPPNAGRKAGTPNKITRTVREAFQEAFAVVNQGPSALSVWGKENPDKFYLLASKLIPTDITSGDKPLGVVLLPRPGDDA